MTFYNNLKIGKKVPFSSDYSRNMQKINFWRSSYNVTSDYLEGKDAHGNEILMPFPCESSKEYSYRKANTKPRNHVGGILQKQNGFVFKNNVERSESDPDYLEFLKSVDLSGKSISEFMQNSLLSAQIDGYSAIIIDHTSKTAETKTLQQSKADGDRYFLRSVKRESIANITYNDDVLTEILIYFVDEFGNDFYRYYNSQFIQDFKTNRYDEIIEIDEAVVHGFFDIPVVIHKPFPNNLESQAAPISELQQGLTHVLSYMAMEIVKSVYTMHVFTGAFPDEMIDENGNVREITFGSGRILYMGENGSVSRMAADTNAATTLQSQIKDTEEAIYRTAGVASSSPFKAGPSQSGLSKLYDLNDLATILSALSRSTQIAENKIMDILFKTMKNLNVNDSIYDMNYNIPEFLTELKELKETLSVKEIPDVIKEKAVSTFSERNFNLSKEEQERFNSELYNKEEALEEEEEALEEEE